MIYKFTAEKTDANLNFDITLEKDKQVYCFISENGVGKTTLLENMAKTLVVYHSIFRDKQGPPSGTASPYPDRRRAGSRPRCSRPHSFCCRA